jgi:hypothetical protein
MVGMTVAMSLDREPVLVRRIGRGLPTVGRFTVI